MLQSGNQQGSEAPEDYAQKKTRRYKERDEEKIAAYLETLEDIPPEKRVYMDQSGSDSCYGREYGYAPRGEQVFGEMYGRKFARTNLIAAQIDGKPVAPMYYGWNTDAGIVEFWFEERLMPLLPPGSVVIMDNASFHRKGILRQIASRYHVMVLFLPPYSPEYNPIEKLWANIKSWLKKNMRNYDFFEDALEAALDAYF